MMNPNPLSTRGQWHGAHALDGRTALAWLDAIAAFTVAQERRALGTTVIRNREKHVRKFALFAKVSPWHVTPDLFDDWLDSLTELAASTVASQRGSVRSFYRWALAAERVTADPTAHRGRASMRLAVPERWDAPIVAFERFLWARGAAPSTVHVWAEQLRTFARDNASIDPFAMTIDDIYEWMAGKRWARETRRARKVTLRAFYGWAVDTERMTEDPTTRLPKVKAGDPVARPATDAEYAEALSNADERWTLALRLAAELGLRRGEVAQVHGNDVRVDEQGTPWLTVHGKGAKIRRVPMPASLAASVRAVGGGYAFPGQVVEKHAHARSEGHLSARYVGKQLAALLPPGVTMHALRHRFATKAYNVDRDVFTVQRLLGHASPATTQRYVQVADERMRALVEAVNGS